MLKEFLKGIENDMASAAFAEAGEFETARQMMREGRVPDKRVLLGADGPGRGEKGLVYAINICRRLGAGLEILYVFRDGIAEGGPLSEQLVKAKAELKPMFERLGREGVRYVLNFGTGALDAEVARYAEGRRDILFVVVESTGGGKKGGLEKTLSRALNKMGCPLVVVSSAAKA